MTTPYFADDAVTLYPGDAEVRVLRELPDSGADLVVTSPRTADWATTAPAGGLVATPRAYIRPGGTPSASHGSNRSQESVVPSGSVLSSARSVFSRCPLETLTASSVSRASKASRSWVCSALLSALLRAPCLSPSAI
jgi:hypothetical protein